MKKVSKKNKNVSNGNLENMVSEYATKKNVLTGLGIASLVGLGVFAAVKWVPFKSIFEQLKNEVDNLKNQINSNQEKKAGTPMVQEG